MNMAQRIDVVAPNGTTTTVVGTTATLQDVSADDSEEIVFLVPVGAITGSPQLLVKSSPDGTTYTTEQTYARSSADNGKTLVVSVARPTKPYYRLTLNLNSGTFSVGVSANGVYAFKANTRKLPVVSSGEVVLCAAAG
jgi:hypothetical protein